MNSEIKPADKWSDLEMLTAVQDLKGKPYVILARDDTLGLLYLLTRAEHSETENGKTPAKIESYQRENIFFSQRRVVLQCPKGFKFIKVDDMDFVTYDKILRGYEE